MLARDPPIFFLSVCCALAVPFVLPTLSTFRVLTDTVGVDYNELRFEEYCVEGSYQGLARDFFENALGLSIFSDAARWLGVSGALRGAEAMDSFDAFSKLENDNNEGHSRVGNMICTPHARPSPTTRALRLTRTCAARRWHHGAWRHRLRVAVPDHPHVGDSTHAGS